MRAIDADRLLTDRMKSKYYHLPNGDIAIPLIDIEHAPTIEPDLSSYFDKLWRNAYERGRTEAEAEQHWIPCSERLPEMTHFTQDVNPFSDDVLVTIRNEYGSKCLLIGFFDSQHGWLFSDQQPIDGFTWKPIAWQPLPDPYKKEGDRNE